VDQGEAERVPKGSARLLPGVSALTRSSWLKGREIQGRLHDLDGGERHSPILPNQGMRARRSGPGA
jgi:hypothetical protein